MSVADIIANFGQLITVTRFGPSIQVQTLEFDSDFVTGNVINLNVNASPILPITFNTDHDSTLADLASSIQLKSGIESAIVTGPRKITITSAIKGAEFLIDGILVTGGASQPSGSITNIEGGYVDGVFQGAADVTFDIIIAIQPFSAEELVSLPEGQRTRRYVKGYSETRLFNARQSEGSKADRIQYDGTVFEVQEVEGWIDANLNHYKMIFAELNPV